MNMNILIGCGPTREYLDPVRFISNPSTGKMGYLIGEECLKRGYTVTIVSGPTYLNPPAGAKLIWVESAEDMRREIVKRFLDADILVMCAAVSDWRPARKSSSKIKQKKVWNLKLVPNPDILKEIAKIKKLHQKTIGFALETSSLLKNAKRKLKEKKLDLIIADTPDFFGEKQRGGKVLFLHKDGRKEQFRKIGKEETARRLVSLLPEV